MVGYLLPPYLLECAVMDNVLRSIEDGNDVQALANVDVEAESLCGAVRGEKPDDPEADSTRKSFGWRTT